ncbi:hypothetical protein C900_05081 [Fulvivirga imtechensis AK7]|uniref:Acyl-CoA reductase n=1 Tax=Fulvivirga imtechensis AK7 TaxID=1237149 RepID=L8JKE7_9BACT|nr:acyl-CoA reductase [Fulvivirga imtechensis]ELR69391.1 hypothetical protein C900_05081 [Fulvivirga imtechensis AK7]
MDIKERIAALSALGQYLENLNENTRTKLHLQARANNNWFTPENVDTALKGIIGYLQKDKLQEWASQYPIKDQNKKVGIVMAGNIPFVGFHDLLSVLISGNQAHIKLSSQDTALIKFIITELTEIAPSFKEQVFIKERLKDIDAIIATGSDNTSRYFEYYFSKYPHIIRKNRTSCAILTGNETSEDFKGLAEDIFLYFGLGCRNVSKLFVPQGYDFNSFFEGIQHYQGITHHHKYSNNYDYNKSIYLVNGEAHFDNGFLMLREEKQMVSPISVVYYEQYGSEDELKSILDQNKEKIQCIVADNWPNSQPFGNAQYPEVWDYADGVDTMKFLSGL